MRIDLAGISRAKKNQVLGRSGDRRSGARASVSCGLDLLQSRNNSQKVALSVHTQISAFIASLVVFGAALPADRRRR
jgi:hypothetical protein